MPTQIPGEIQDTQRRKLPTPDYSKRKLAGLYGLAQKVAVVTGGAKGIGAACCRRLVEAGAKVILADADEVAAIALIESLRGEDAKIHFKHLDSNSSSQFEELADWTLLQEDRIDIWINTVSNQVSQSSFDLSEADWNAALQNNLGATFYGSRAAARRMRKSGLPGVILNVASPSSCSMSGASAVSSLADTALRGLTAALAKEWSGYGIRVLSIAPGILSENLAGEISKDLHSNVFSDRSAVPDDIARAVVWLVSDAAAYVSGSTLWVDGGRRAGECLN